MGKHKPRISGRLESKKANEICEEIVFFIANKAIVIRVDTKIISQRMHSFMNSSSLLASIYQSL